VAAEVSHLRDGRHKIARATIAHPIVRDEAHQETYAKELGWPGVRLLQWPTVGRRRARALSSRDGGTMDRRTRSRPGAEAVGGLARQERVVRDGPMRLAVRRVRLRSLARVGLSIGWLVSLPPALLASAGLTWLARRVWSTLDGWEPWMPWPANTRVGPITLPTPEFKPREALQVEGLYQWLEPLARHPWLGGLLVTLALTALGGLLVALTLTLAGAGYNLFARATGGLELELAPRPSHRRYSDPPPAHFTPRVTRRVERLRDREDEWEWEEDAELRW
jgi:hypothetical protein